MVRKYSAKADKNQPEIVAEYRRLGASAQHVHMVGKGFVDIVVGYRGFNELVEIKDPKQPMSKRKLNKEEQKWHDNWSGTARVIETKEDVLAHILELRNEANASRE